MLTAHSKQNSKQAVQKRATALLDWLIDFLPGTIPHSAEEAIIDDLVREANLVCNKTKKGVEYAVPEGIVSLLKVAEPRAAYGRRTVVRKRGSNR